MYCEGGREKVVGGEVLWKPVDRASAMLLAKAPWYCQPPTITQPPQPAKKKERRTRMSKHAINETTLERQLPPGVPGQPYVSKSGIRVVRVNGEDMFCVDDIQAVICAEIANLPKETRPNVQAAEDARKIIGELTDGIGGQMEKFRANTKMYLDDIRQTRFAVVNETNQMMGPLKDIRQFFLGPDYKDEIARLRDFVDLCERLQKLKESGFLDNVADTMLRLSK